jgi:hypothetical protein
LAILLKVYTFAICFVIAEFAVDPFAFLQVYEAYAGFLTVDDVSFELQPVVFQCT